MQQYFMDRPLEVGQKAVFTKEQAHHAGTVVRLNREVIRLVHDGKGYFAVGAPEGKGFSALVTEEDPNVNELNTKITLAMALIRREKMEWVLQKATELGVSRIVPFVSGRCVVKNKKEKTDRWNTIVLEAAQQCKRNFIPEITGVVSLKDLKDYRSEVNLAAFEKASEASGRISKFLPADSVTVVIGPEGGFSDDEVSLMSDMEFHPITLGNRILRAETAAVYAVSVIGEYEEGAR
ncbi:MAG: 16S rRNA (uracil(1498)-N(3))-methyltransferase [Solobacterium sp.]|nr:16S rRNA (uracil(1498)-N(3))-methyltransferase [Solobacterium sp.]